jgi:hypothetical protein
MPLLRVKVVLNEGGEGVPLSQLTDIANEVENFLRYLADDAGIEVNRADWLARAFENKSVRFDVERESRISTVEAKEFNRKFEYVDSVRAKRRKLNGEVRHRTLVQYTKVANALGPHEKIGFGLYRIDAQEPYKYTGLTKRDAEMLASFLSEEATYRGTIHGKIHNVGIEDLWFQLRRSGSNDLVRCDFREALYSEVHEACNRRNALVYVHGLITARRVDQQVTEMRAEKLKVAPSLSDEQYRAFFGADPEYTGKSSSGERNRYEH